MQRNAVASHLITAHALAPLLVARGRGLVIEITDGIEDGYRGTLPYDLAKASVIRIAEELAADLRPHGVAALALTPGFLRSEAVLDHFGVREDNWRDAIARDPHFAHSETPRLLGRAVVALAADPAIMERSGGRFATWTLAREYGLERRRRAAARLGRALRDDRFEWRARARSATTPCSTPPRR